MGQLLSNLLTNAFTHGARDRTRHGAPVGAAGQGGLLGPQPGQTDSAEGAAADLQAAGSRPGPRPGRRRGSRPVWAWACSSARKSSGPTAEASPFPRTMPAGRRLPSPCPARPRRRSPGPEGNAPCWSRKRDRSTCLAEAFLFLQPEHAPLHLAGGGHGQGIDELDLLGVLVGRQQALDMGLQSASEFSIKLACSPRLTGASSYEIRSKHDIGLDQRRRARGRAWAPLRHWPRPGA